ncbi:hypothetical protein H9L39_16247 [Fusarium oxysporum f. sp. albedinis]|nr:hypothetical protein H9L39_16247 [Fusarium oxysporum f. sp. albedinis]
MTNFGAQQRQVLSSKYMGLSTIGRLQLHIAKSSTANGIFCAVLKTHILFQGWGMTYMHMNTIISSLSVQTSLNHPNLAV